MKGLLCACLLVLLQSTPAAQAYEGDIHFSATYVLARAVGWEEADALTIASANQGVDENEATVAALEVDSTPSQSLAGYITSSLHQAEKNLRFHCFSTTRGQQGRISDDVLKVMSGHFASVPDRDDSPRGNTAALIALGAALHCQQDAHAHVSFGGSCGSYSGSCYGHTHQNFLDQLLFSLLKKHYFNPDHPGVSGEELLEALQGTADELSARRPKRSLRSVSHAELLALTRGLRSSGLELPDDVRRECNQYIAGKWLHDIFQSGRQPHDAAGKVQVFPPEVAGKCRNASLASAAVVLIPPPRFPRLNPDASPYLVKADGTYQLIPVGASSFTQPGIGGGVSAGHRPHHDRGAKVQLSHWSHVLALPLARRVTLSSASGNRQNR